MSTLLFLMTLLPVVFMLHDFEGIVHMSGRVGDISQRYAGNPYVCPVVTVLSLYVWAVCRGKISFFLSMFARSITNEK